MITTPLDDMPRNKDSTIETTAATSADVTARAIAPTPKATTAASKSVRKKPVTKAPSAPADKVDRKAAKPANSAKPAPSKSKPASKALPAPKGPRTAPLKIAASPWPDPMREPGKEKLVRDSFTMPPHDFRVIAVLKDRALGFKRPAKKSELLRAGLHALAALSDAKLRQALDALTPLKAGRPLKAK